MDERKSNNPLPSDMFSMKRAPILWVGSGISKRYVEGFQTWDELLSSVAGKFGISPGMYAAIRMEASREVEDPKRSPDLVAMKTASKLSSRLISMISDGSIEPTDILSENDAELFLRGVDPIKLLVCASIRNVTFRKDMEIEIELFSRLRESVPAVVTTNYDTVVEMLFGEEFKVFSDVDDYYGLDSMGVGEIYKIHGTVSKPRSIFLLEEDIKEYQHTRPVISSKIISLMCESPLLILGHSMDDSIIRDTIADILDCFSGGKAAEVSRNIVCVRYSDEDEVTMKGSMQIESRGRFFQVQTIVTNELIPIIEDASQYRRTLTVGQIRTFRRMMVDASLSRNPNQNHRLAFVGIEGIDDIDPERTVIALTSRVYLDAAKSFTAFTNGFPERVTILT
ncbi:MAG: SIR2 family protein [Thermoplasmata archaeon]|nr:SIR2 family protein [Thermoplasmata archaeon]